MIPFYFFMNKLKNKALYLILVSVTLLLVLLCHRVFATERWAWHDRVFNNYSVKQGLPHGSIPVITEDNYGFIWLSTSEGVMRFDGHNFEAIMSKYPQVNNTKVISRDPKGILWLGTDKGLIRLDPETRLFTPHNLLPKKSTSIVSIAMDKSANSPFAWIGTNQGVFKFNTQTFKAELFLQQKFSTDAGIRIFSVLNTDNETVWVGTNRGLLYKRKEDKIFSHFDLSTTLTSSTRISALLQASNGDVWVGTPRDGVLVISSKLTITQPVIPNFSREWLYAIAEVSPGVIWLGSYGQGIIQMNLKGQEVIRIRHNRLMNNSLADDEIWTLYRAKNDLVWIGTSKGLSLYNAKQKSVKNLFGDIDQVQGISDANVSSLLEDKEGKIWLGLRKKGIDILDPLIGRVDHLAVKPQTPEVSLPGGAIETMALHSSGDVYIGSNWGVYRYHQSELGRLNFKGKYANKYIGTIQVSGDTIWAGGTDGLWRFDLSGEQKTASQVTDKLASFTDNRISAIAETLEDELVVGTWNGVNWIDKEGKLSYQLAKDVSSDMSTINAFISSIFYDASGRLWVATEGEGIYVGQAKNHPEEFIHITKEQGLLSNTIRSMQPDEQGRVWVGSSAGINVIAVDSLSVQSLLPQEGALLAPYSRQAVLKTSAGEIIFGGNGGLTVIDINKWRANSTFSPLTIVTSHISGKTDYSPTLGTELADPVVVEAEQNKLSIEFVALDYIDAEAIEYRYRLSGLSEEWHTSNSQHRVAAFTTLPPGNYQLEIQNSNRLGHWNPQTHFIHIQVLPYWYQTFWAKLAGLFLVVILALLIIRFRTARLRKRQLSLEKQVKQRTLSLQKAKEELDRVSVTDPLTNMNNRRFLERNMPAESALVSRKYHNYSGSKNRIAGADLVFFLIDIDHFKKINDKYGHKAGDDVLVEVTKRLKRVARESDFLVRWGGEEFLLVVRGTSVELAKLLAQRLCQQFKGEPIKLNEDTEILITCSIGFTPYPFYTDKPDEISWLECIDIADKGLYAAKNSGRDAWVGVTAKEPINDEKHHEHVMDIAQGLLCLETNLERKFVESNWQKF